MIDNNSENLKSDTSDIDPSSFKTIDPGMKAHIVHYEHNDQQNIEWQLI